MAETYTINEILKNKVDWEDIKKIGNHIHDFAVLMRDRMFDEAIEGQVGWDESENRDRLVEYLSQHIKKEDWLDAANFCLMLHFIDNPKGNNQ